MLHPTSVISHYHYFAQIICKLDNPRMANCLCIALM